MTNVIIRHDTRSRRNMVHSKRASGVRRMNSPFLRETYVSDLTGEPGGAVRTGANLPAAKFHNAVMPDGSIKNLAIWEPDREPRSS